MCGELKEKLIQMMNKFKLFLYMELTLKLVGIVFIMYLVYKEGYKIGYKNSWLDQAQGRKKEFDF
jgi:hypothetical protein